MSLLINNLKNNKRLVIFITILFLIGFSLGIMYYFFQNIAMKEVIVSSISINDLNEVRINNIIPHLIIFSSIIALTILLIGLPVSMFYLFYEAFSLGFSLMVLATSLKTTGFIFYLKYIIFFKIIYLLLILLYNIAIIKIFKNNIKMLLNKDSKYKNKMQLNIKKACIFFILIILLDIIIYFISPLIFKYLF